MKRVCSFVIAFIMAGTIFVVPAGVSYANETEIAEETIATEQAVSEEEVDEDSPIVLESKMVSLSSSSFTYRGKEILPKVTVKYDGDILRKKTDYTVSYDDNKDAGEGKVIVNGIGKYTGTVTKTFTIKQASIGSSNVKLSATEYPYRERAIKPSVTVTLGNVILDKSDYVVKYSNNKYPGTATVTVTGRNNLKSTTVKKNFYIGRILSYKALGRTKTSVKILWTSRPHVDGYIVYRKKSGEWKRVKTVKGSKNNSCTISNLSPGGGYNFLVRAYVKTSKKTYYGSSKKSIWVATTPSKASISAVESFTDRTARIKWKKQNSTGYQIVLSRYSDFRKYSSYKNKSSATSKTFKGLTTGKKYYVKVRAYKTAGGKTVYGSWSKVRSFTARNKGWMTKDGAKYYCINGKRLTGYHKIGGKQYYFTSTGRWGGLSKKMWDKVKNQSSRTKWLIAVSRDKRRVIVYTGKKGDWNPKYYWKCTVGAKATPTPAGVFTVPKNKTYQLAFGRNDGYMAWYSTKIKGPYLFHSVLYQPGSKTEFYDGRLGQALSHGCIRLELKNAKWIQDNIRPGTKVIIY